MTFYQIIRTQIINGDSSNPKFKSFVVDSVMGEKDAIRMLNSYRQTQNEDESYQIKKVETNLKFHKW